LCLHGNNIVNGFHDSKGDGHILPNAALFGNAPTLTAISAGNFFPGIFFAIFACFAALRELLSL